MGIEDVERNDVRRYEVEWNEKEWIKYGRWLAAPREQKYFTEERILVQQIIDWSSLRILAGWTDSELYNTQNQFNLLSRSGSNLKFILSVINSKLMSYYHRKVFLDIALQRFQKILIKDAKRFPVPQISFTTPEKDRKERVRKAIELYESYMVELEQKGNANEKTEASAEHNRAVGEPVAGGKEGKVSGEHPGASARIHGVRGRTRKPEDAERISEEPEGGAT